MENKNIKNQIKIEKFIKKDNSKKSSSDFNNLIII